MTAETQRDWSPIEQCLNDGWLLREEPLARTTEDASDVFGNVDGWLTTSVPADVRQPLIAAGIIKEPLVAENFVESQWVEDRSWWFSKSFLVDDSVRNAASAELRLDSLDCEADIFFNGHHLGHHRNAHRPFVSDIAALIRDGENHLGVRLTCGADVFSAADVASTSDDFTVPNAPVESQGTRVEKRRTHLRKPQYSYGWDHVPRVPSCGIMGAVSIAGYNRVAIHGLKIEIESIQPSARAHVQLELETFDDLADTDVSIEISALLNGDAVVELSERRTLPAGMSWPEFEIEIHDPKLWWPNGHGEQPLYDLLVCISDQDRVVARSETRFGVRTIELRTEPINQVDSTFQIVVNGRPIFAQGANWVPPDVLYARAGNEKYDALLIAAKEAHFTMLRVWGGGIYERDHFYDRCDELGLLVWQDFMFACARYPDDLDWFVDEVEREATHQVSRLRNHASMALWCGNNENEMMFDDRWTNPEYRLSIRGSGLYIAGHVLPRVVKETSPKTPYWTSSPFGGSTPNSPHRGDMHWWDAAGMNDDMAIRTDVGSYDPITAKFVSEFGYIGPPGVRSISEYLENEDFQIDDPAYLHHSNGFDAGTSRAGVERYYNATDMTRDEFIQFAGVRQGTMLGHAFSSMRFEPDCWGALSWDFDDSWGEVGWSLVDYYSRKKPAYHVVKWALRSRTLTLRDVGGQMWVAATNFTPEALDLEAEIGHIGSDGQRHPSGVVHLSAPPWDRSRTAIGPIAPSPAMLMYVLPLSLPEIGSATLPLVAPKDMDLPNPEIQIDHLGHAQRDDRLAVQVTSDSFAHAVHFSLPDNAQSSENYFDLLPGEAKIVHFDGVKAASDVEAAHLWQRGPGLS